MHTAQEICFDINENVEWISQNFHLLTISQPLIHHTSQATLQVLFLVSILCCGSTPSDAAFLTSSPCCGREALEGQGKFRRSFPNVVSLLLLLPWPSTRLCCLSTLLICWLSIWICWLSGPCFFRSSIHCLNIPSMFLQSLLFTVGTTWNRQAMDGFKINRLHLINLTPLCRKTCDMVLPVTHLWSSGTSETSWVHCSCCALSRAPPASLSAKNTT